ncbi:MAG: hypothetical protein A2538_02155 [Candidatus Magasanikbacteria bacterium RIFOXYD2_FULL_41_14]|uniref:Uncharacterized protein n=1 Tax=Candidatus Magasanikbacteria bacterium RIFOXYD2_FULL_41_14 TaxID=1798709 RepID=A0A1F6PD41_9BACT|nr:MAG: hypothetical protein A2538_02155 [Candidatus Magasanikbacteria bacterium RIFOXYD2_FULL_41_14]
MFNWKQITSHPRLTAVVDVLGAVIFLWWLNHLNVTWELIAWIFSRALFITVLVRFTFYPTGWNRLRHLASLYLFNFGFLLVLLFTEWRGATILADILFIFAPAVSFWLLPARSDTALIDFKPYRRARLALSVLGLSGMWMGIFASITLNIFKVNFWLWLILGALISALTALWWWREYENTLDKKQWLWFGAMFMMILELAWVIYLLPIGYFITGVVMAWFWYCLWIFVRFHLNSAGINWHKQKNFLIINGGWLILLLVFLARWR